MSTMLELTKAKLDEFQALAPRLNSITTSVVDAIPYPTVNYRMKATIAISHIMQFASQFRRNIVLWDETSVPINSLGVVLCDSGAGKDSSHRAAKRCFSSGYEILHKETETRARKLAIERATAAEEELPREYEIYKKYLDPIPPIESSVTTGPGLIKLLNDTDLHTLGANSLYSGEFGDELSYNQDMVENIKILSELYDLGFKEATYTKGAEFRSKAINGQAVSALLIGSPTYILYDEQTKRKFQIAFMSKLARRSWFCYAPERIPEPDFSSHKDPISAMIAAREEIETRSKQARIMIDEQIKSVTKFNISNTNELKVTNEVFALFETYKRYNSELADSMLNKESTSALIRRHLQWKALKLAGAFAIMDCANSITITHYVEAIQFSELLSNDMALFEQDLNKSYYERFSDYAKTLVTQDGSATISSHDIKKHGFLPSVSKQKLHEMISLCAGYDKEGIYSIVEDGNAIEYKPIVKTDIINISYKPIDNYMLNSAIKSGDKKAITEAKGFIASNAVHGFESAETSFAELSDLLYGDYAYSPFKFLNGTRDRSNIIGGTKWLVYDIDDAPISASETHFMLSDINHHIALSSDPSNEFKFRILIELDSTVELNAVTWKHFYLTVANDLALVVDPLPQSQIFFSYADRPVYSNTSAEPLPVRDYVMKAIDLATVKESVTKATPAFKSSQLSDPETTFFYAFQAEKGSRSRNLIRAVYHAKDLGASLDDTIQLATDINEYWSVPMEQSRFEATILAQIPRIFNKQ